VAVVVDVVVLREPRRDRRVALLVGDERREDLHERRIGSLLAMHVEQRAGERLDAGHVDEVLDDRLLLLARQLRRGKGPVEVVDRPLVANAFVEHAPKVHAVILLHTARMLTRAVALACVVLVACGGGEPTGSGKTLAAIRARGEITWGADRAGGEPYVY